VPFRVNVLQVLWSVLFNGSRGCSRLTKATPFFQKSLKLISALYLLIFFEMFKKSELGTKIKYSLSTRTLNKNINKRIRKKIRDKNTVILTKGTGTVAKFLYFYRQNLKLV